MAKRRHLCELQMGILSPFLKSGECAPAFTVSIVLFFTWLLDPECLRPQHGRCRNIEFPVGSFLSYAANFTAYFHHYHHQHHHHHHHHHYHQHHHHHHHHQNQNNNNNNNNNNGNNNSNEERKKNMLKGE